MAKKTRRAIVAITHIALILGILATPVVRADTPPPGVDVPLGRSAMLQPAAIPTTQVTMDEEGYTLWTMDWGDVSWCVPVSTLRYPFDLGTQDPTRLTDASLILEFSEGLYHPDVQDPSWTVALNGSPPDDWQSVGNISGPMSGAETILNTAVITFDALRLIDGENNIWLQQHDLCPQEPGCTTCACTCIDLKRYTLRAGVDLGISKVSPEPDIRNVWPDQREDSEIRVKFTTLVSPTTVNEETFQLFYYDQDLNQVVVDGRVDPVSNTEFTFTPAQALKDGIRYEVQIWDEDEALWHGRDQWVKDAGGDPLENGRIWSFWTMPKIEVKLVPVQVLESFNYQLVQNKPTALKVYMRWDSKPDVFRFDQLDNIEVNDIIIKWQKLDGSVLETVNWNSSESYGWQPAWSTTAALRKREYREYTGEDDSYTLKEKFLKLADSVNYYGFLPRETGFYLITAQVKVLDNHGKVVFFNNPQIPDVIASGRTGIHMRAVAVGADYGKTGTVDLSAVINDHLGGVKAIFPVSTVPRPAAPGAMPWYTPKTTLWAYSWSIRPVWPYVHPYQYLLQEMDQLCKITDGCRAMVGLVNRAWLVDLGLTLREAASAGALVDYAAAGESYRFITAHEIGHLTGIDEHLTQPGGEGFDVLGRRDRRNSVVPSFDYMHIDPAEYYMWIADARYYDLLTWTGAKPPTQQLQARTVATTTDALLLAGGTITHTTGEVQLLPWYQLEPGTWDAPEPGPYKLVFLNSAGQEIAGYAQPFTATATLRPAEFLAAADLTSTAPLTDILDMGLFSLKVPFSAATAKIQIVDTTGGETVLEEIVVSDAPPTLVIDTPGNATWNGPQTLTWQSDAAHFIVSVSTDSGATWQAQAIHLSAPGYTLETTALPDTDQAMIRVAATDGLRTTVVVTGPFTIDNPPQIAFVSPSDGATGVGIETSIVVGFRDAMDPASITASTFIVTGGPFGAVTGAITYDSAAREATFTPAVPLAYDAVYTATLTPGARDASGEAMPVATTWTFTTTADFVGPRPNAFSPANGALDVPRNAQIVASWDKPLDVGTLGVDTFTVTTGAGAPVNGVVTYDAATRTTIFSPTTLLTVNTRYIVTLKAGIQDGDGNPTESDFAWAFTTGDTNPALAFTGSYADWGHDTDGDSLYEYLVIQVGVQVTTTDVYRLKGVLNDSAGAEITWASHTATLQPGASFMPLAFDGASIGGHGVDGPYTLTGLTLSRVGTGGASVPLDQAMEVYRTFAYPVARFPAPLRFTGLPDVLLRPEEVPLTPVFNARNYAQHVLLDSAQLTYTLLFNSDLCAGVTLDSNGNLWVNPTSDWMGYSDVTLQATDGVLMAQDTFRVTVGWAHSLYLPLILRNSAAALAVRSNWVVALSDDFEADGPWRYGSSISVPPGGWYYGGRRDCKAYSGQYSMWPFGDGEDGALLPCNAAYPNTLVSNMVSGISFNLEHTTQAELRMKVWTDLAPGDEICAMAALDAPVPDDDPRWLTYYGVCRSGTSNGWEDLALDLSDVPVIGNLIGQEKIWIAVRFQANETESRPGGAYVDDVVLRICPEGLTCDPALGYITLDKPSTTSIGSFDGSVSEAALAVEDNGRVHVAWTGTLNPHFDTFAFYASAADGANWTPYQILNYWQDYDPQLAVDNTRHQAHLIYRSNYDGILHHTVADGVVSDPNVLDRDGVTSPKIAVNPTTGYAYAVWHKGYYFPIGSDVLSWRRRLWYASWDGASWSAPQWHVNDGDTEYGAIAAAPEGGVMLAWFQQWSQSIGGALDPGDPIVPRTAYGTNPNDFPLRQAVSAPYELPEKDNSILLTYSPGDQKYYLASTHLMWPGHSRVYRYVWENGAWAGPLDVAGNTSGWANVWYIGAASDQPLVYYVYRTDAGFYVRTETNGVLSAARSLTDDLAARGYTGTPIAFFVDHAGGLHMVVSGAKDGVAGFYYVHP